ncbi:MAG: signal peptidase I [Candidatus Nanoarchaeia archaeon]
MWGKLLGIIIAAFLLGWTTHIIAVGPDVPVEAPVAQEPKLTLEQPSPSDWVQQSQIHLTGDQVIIDLEDPQWAVFTNTNSMDPVIDETSHAIQRVPKSEKEIHVGDIISYESSSLDSIVIHRVVEIGDDGEWYARTKGDNNPYKDPSKVRFSKIKRVLVAVIY